MTDKQRDETPGACPHCDHEGDFDVQECDLFTSEGAFTASVVATCPECQLTFDVWAQTSIVEWIEHP